MKNTQQQQSRLLRSAEELKAYFEEKMKKSTLGPERAALVREALEQILTSVRDMEASREALDRLHARLGTIQQEIPSNVIPLRWAPERTRPTAFSPINSKRWALRLDCLIEATYVSEIHKMAMELHSHSRHYAFIEYRDLDRNARHRLPDLLAVGAISLFIPNILDLTAPEQEMLSELIQVGSSQRPLLMVGSTIPFSQLRGEAGVSMRFLNQLARAYIKLTRPFAEYKEQDLIHYFLDSLSESPT